MPEPWTNSPPNSRFTDISFADFAAMFSRPAVDGKPATSCIGYAAHDNAGVLVPMTFDRAAPGPSDVRIQITHCGELGAELLANAGCILDKECS